MKKWIFKLFMTIMLVLGFQWIFAQDKPDQQISDLSKSILVDKKSPIITIRLRTNASTGYSWFLLKYDHHFITPISQEIEPAANMEPGASAVSVWKFKVSDDAFIVPHILEIDMLYARSWETTGRTRQRITIVTEASH